jgi:hypothetical protein
MSKPTTLGHLVDAHVGRAALILGGGPSLPEEFEAAYDAYPDALLVSVNAHGCLLGVAQHKGKDLLAVRRELVQREPRLVRCDYACHLDDFGFWEMSTDVKRVSMLYPADVKMLEHPRGTGSSGMVAAWFAYMVGCAPVILCGMDCYGRGSYWHSPKFTATSGLSSPPAHHVREWAEKLPTFMPQQIVRAAGGPLVDVFGRMEPGLTFAPLDKDVELREIEFLQRTRIGDREYVPQIGDAPPDIARFPYKQASWLVETGRAAFR